MRNEEPGRAPSISWRQEAQRLQQEAEVFFFAFKHPRVRWYARLVPACTVAYLFSPVQLIPSFIPVIGFLDDFAVILLGANLLRRIIPADVLAECRQLAEAAETRRKEEIRSTAAAAGLAAIVTLWLFAAVIASALLMRFIRS